MSEQGPAVQPHAGGPAIQTQWEPGEKDIAGARVTDFARFVEARTGRQFDDYAALWRWSVEDLEDFWAALWDYFDLGERGEIVLESADMPGASTSVVREALEG